MLFCKRVPKQREDIPRYSKTIIIPFWEFKDKIPLCVYYNNVYKFACGRCNTTRYGKTCRHLRLGLVNNQVSRLQQTNSPNKKNQQLLMTSHSCAIT